MLIEKMLGFDDSIPSGECIRTPLTVAVRTIVGNVDGGNGRIADRKITLSFGWTDHPYCQRDYCW